MLFDGGVKLDKTMIIPCGGGKSADDMSGRGLAICSGDENEIVLDSDLVFSLSGERSCVLTRSGTVGGVPGR